jgi:hypothetical protein
MTTIIEAANELVKTFSAVQITALEKLGWTFMMTGPNEWDWMKVEPGLTRGGYHVCARGGDETWARDVAEVCRD